MKASLILISCWLISSALARKTCVIPASKVSGADDSLAIIDAFSRCKKNGEVVFSKGTTYNVQKAMNITGLDDVHISLRGKVLFSDDMEYWQKNIFALNFQSAGTWWVIGGRKIIMNGGGTIDGNGQVWWDAQAIDPRPVALTFDKVTDLKVEDVSFAQAPFWHLFVRDAQDVIFDRINIRSVTNSTFPTHNSDGWDLFRSSNVVIKNSVIVNGDDCVSLKANATDVTIKNLSCTGSHGVSIGSLGQYSGIGQIDVVKNVLVKDVTCINCSNGARIKTWPGGLGLVENITFDHMNVTNVDYPVMITTHYCDNNQMEFCSGADTHSLTIKDVVFNDIYGTISSAKKPIVSLNCSSETPCSNISLTKIKITPTASTPKNVCDYVTGSENISYCNA
ncbi:glycoside hydrolase family 28 protein [Phycomyces blakesleeanus]|uniref:Glycoside hydrolase family 28 protein n=2 Tax=Phycomyces blakesleeanus TaxID=4837 RepID=A0A162X6D9_PHYB8|nr:glycoside hydrolase family 28 protein [Phycomyces blakesleeanus NRRL 1555(-)]OAD72795.1 glycoside hydrolase family 28 protein [Phycomyces blakesleeanus NRRL 1555(-)]|eukprot:XP_018290835.1 glycoside hydrolase family 28 protein [Phycomyces blakesleeanus NRRL 1555(-)]